MMSTTNSTLPLVTPSTVALCSCSNSELRENPKVPFSRKGSGYARANEPMHRPIVMSGELSQQK